MDLKVKQIFTKKKSCCDNYSKKKILSAHDQKRKYYPVALAYNLEVVQEEKCVEN